MTYPQPTASGYVTADQQTWRLNTLLASPGDIYESDEGLLALAVGPDSDISRVLVTYYDTQVPVTRTNSLVISPDRSMVGRIAARLDQPYPLTAGLAGRILVSSLDIYDPTYLPPSATQNLDRRQILAPRLDVIGYFNNPPSLIPQRSDGNFYTQAYDTPPALGAGPVWPASFVVIPYYGRKYGDFLLQNESPASVEVSLTGIDYTTDDGVILAALETPLIAPVAVAVGAQVGYRIRASIDGMFDAVVVGIRKLSGAVDVPLSPIFTTFRTSDDAL